MFSDCHPLSVQLNLLSSKQNWLFLIRKSWHIWRAKTRSKSVSKPFIMFQCFILMSLYLLEFQTWLQGMPWFTWTNQKIVIEGEWDSNLKHPVCYCCVDKFNVVYVVNIFFKRYLQKIYFCLFATWHFVSQAKNHLYFQVRRYHQQPLNFSFWRIYLFVVQNLNENCLNVMANFSFNGDW